MDGIEIRKRGKNDAESAEEGVFENCDGSHVTPERAVPVPIPFPVFVIVGQITVRVQCNSYFV